MENVVSQETEAQETVAERYFRLEVDDRRYLPEGSTGEKEWLDEAVQTEHDLIEAYLYAHIAPATLPVSLENRILKGEYSQNELDFMARELLQSQFSHK